MAVDTTTEIENDAPDALAAPTASLLELHALRHAVEWGQWRQLTRAAPPFLTPEFFSLVQPFAESDGPPLVAMAWQKGELIGALPLRREGRVLHAFGTVYTPAFDYWGAPAGLEAIWEALHRDTSWDELVLEGVAAESLLAFRLPELAHASGCPAVLHPRGGHPYFALPGFAARLSPKFRVNVERCARKAGDLRLERLTTPTRADLDEAFAIEALAWKDAAGTSIKADARASRFYRTLVRFWGRRGQAALYFLRANGKRFATLFALEDGRTLYALKIGYDPQFASLSPGHLLIWRVAADAESRGLAELNFIGHHDGWKHKWTELVHDRPTVVVYRLSPRGLAHYLGREQLRPRIPPRLLAGRHGALAAGCQRTDLVTVPSRLSRVLARLERGLGVRRRLRAWLSPASAGTAPPRLGQLSRFAVGSWVRVVEQPRVDATLDPDGRLRGLAFTPAQRETCGKVYRVSSAVRRIRDDSGKYRAVSRTVLLEGADCGGHGPAPMGCGRHCPLMYRDEWLEPTKAPTHAPPPPDTRPRAHVKDLEEIKAGLDVFGRRDGLSFMPEMRAYAGRRLPIAARLPRVFEAERWSEPVHGIYLLDGAHCQGEACGTDGPCDRACMLLWHEDWLCFDRPEDREDAPKHGSGG